MLGQALQKKLISVYLNPAVQISWGTITISCGYKTIFYPPNLTKKKKKIEDIENTSFLNETRSQFFVVIKDLRTHFSGTRISPRYPSLTVNMT